MEVDIKIESVEDFLKRIIKEHGEDEIKKLTHNYDIRYINILYGISLSSKASAISEIIMRKMEEHIHNNPIELNSLEELKESIEKQYDKKNIAIL